MVCEKTSFCNAKNVFYLKETSRWSYIVENAGANDIAVIIDQAMADIAEMIEHYSGVVYDPCCGSRVIIMITACSNDRIRLSSHLQKSK